LNKFYHPANKNRGSKCYNTLMDESKQQAGWTFNPEEEVPPMPAAQATGNLEPVIWTGSEYIAEHKDGSWYMALIGGVAVFCTGTYFLTGGDIVSVVAIAVIGILFGIIASRKPNQRRFTIDEKGVSIDDRLYPYSDFKSFSVIHDGAIGYISFYPLQRLRPELAVYYPPEHEQRLFDLLSSHLPYEERSESKADRFSKKIRF
jgi:hypothetical protein